MIATLLVLSLVLMLVACYRAGQALVLATEALDEVRRVRQRLDRPDSIYLADLGEDEDYEGDEC